MDETNINKPAVVRTDRGLSVSGTRITLYQIMDYVKAGRSPAMIREHFRLTVKQTHDILEYIRTHSETVEAEYRQVLDYDEEIRQYWEKRNKKHFEKIRYMPQNLEKSNFMPNCKPPKNGWECDDRNID